MASSSAMTTRVLTVGSFLRRCGRRRASRALGQQPVEQLVLRLLEAGDAREQVSAMALHGVGVALRVVVLAVGQRGLRHEGAQPCVVGGLGEVRELLVGHGEVVAQLPEARGDLRETALDEGPGHRRQSTPGAARAPSRMRDDAGMPQPRRHRIWPAVGVVALALAVALASAACGDGGGSAGSCGPITREALDASYLVHVLGDDAAVEYTSDPPTSGPHQPGPPVEGVVDKPISRPVQVGILERGDVLLQHGPDVPAADLADLEALGGPGVVVAPNPDLPDLVVATAWTYKRTCSAVDVDALQAFIDARAGKGPEG